MAGSIRDRLTAAVAQLKKAGQNDSAAAVESVLAPRGYLLLKKDEQRTSASTLTITITEDLKKALVAAGAEFGVVFSGLAEEAYRKVRAHTWVPPKAGRGKGGTKAVLNVSIDGELRQDVQEMLAELSEEVGYRISEGNIVLSYICEEVGVERPNTGTADTLRLVLPAPLVEYLKEQVKAERLTFQKILADGLDELEEGGQVVALNQWITDINDRPRDAGRWAAVTPESPLSMVERTKLDVKMSRTNLERLRHHAEVETSRHGVLVHPGAVARAILTDRLGEPTE